MTSWSYPDDDSGSWTDRSSSPGKFEEEYHPLVSDHNDRTSYIATPLKNVFTAQGDWSVLVRFDETTILSFTIRGEADPPSGYVSLQIGAKSVGRQLNHVVLMEIHVATQVIDEYSRPHIVHFTEQCPSYVLKQFMRLSDMNYRLAMPNSEFIVFLSLNSDPDYFCHEIGHRRTLSCELAKRTFKWAKIRHYQRLPSIDTLLKRPVSYNSTPATPDYRFPLQGMAPSTSRQQKSRTCVLICEEKGFQVDLNVIQSISRTAKKLLPRVPYKRGPYYLNVRNGSLETLRIFVDFINGKRTWHGTKKLVCLDELRRFAFGELSYRDEWKSSEMKKLLIGLDVSKSSLCALCVSQSVRAKLPRSKPK